MSSKMAFCCLMIHEQDVCYDSTKPNANKITLGTALIFMFCFT